MSTERIVESRRRLDLTTILDRMAFLEQLLLDSDVRIKNAIKYNETQKGQLVSSSNKYKTK